MENTKLSNTSSFQKNIADVPGEINKFTSDIHNDIDEIRKTNDYLIKMTALQMFMSIVLAASGMACIIFAEKIRDRICFWLNDLLFYIDVKKINIDISVIRIAGVTAFIFSANWILRMIFANELRSGDKKINKMSEKFKDEYSSKLKNNDFVDKLNAKIDAFEDDEISETSYLSLKLDSFLSKLSLKNRITGKVVMISRLLIPVMLFAVSAYILLSSECITEAKVVISFVIMFIGCKRSCLIQEYKPGNICRIILCILPAAYGVTLYVSMSALGDQYFFSENKLNGIMGLLLSVQTLTAVIQTLCLIATVWSVNYIAEKKYRKEGVPKKKGKRVYSLSSVYTRIFTMMFAMGIISLLTVGCIFNGFDMAGAIVLGIVLGILWRLFSPVWPLGARKIISVYWGFKYSIIVELFFIAAAASAVMISGTVITSELAANLISMFVMSALVFGLIRRRAGK